MKFKVRIVLLFLLFVLSLTSCAQKDSGDSVKSEQERFDTFTNQLFTDEVQLNTLNLHYMLANPENYGITDYPITLGDYSVQSFEDSKSDLEHYLKTLKKISYDKLTDNQQLTYDILKQYLNTELSASDLYLYSEVLSPTIGNQAQIPILFAEYTFYDENDINDYLVLLAQLDEYYQSILDFERVKSENGLFMSDFAVNAIVQQCQSFIENPDDNYLVEVFNDKIDAFPDLTDEQRNTYKDENLTVIKNHVIRAYELLINGLTELKGTGTNQGGLCNFEKGKEYYEYLVKSGTGSTKSIDEIANLARDSISQNIMDMSEILTANPSLETSLYDHSFALTDPTEILADLTEKIKTDFPDAPATNYSVKYVHQSLQDNLSPAFYLTPPLDDISQNVIYINGSERYKNTDLYTTIAHEGYPGHLYQSIYFNATKPAPIRSLLSFGGYTEGWATYVELYSYHLSGLDDNLAQLLELNNSFSLGLYALIDIGVNYEGWTLAETNDFLEAYGIQDISIAKEIYQNMVMEPANYLKYYVGYLEILELKNSAEKQLGDQFNLKDFHEFMLKTGPAQFNVIQKYMNEWIKDQK